MRILTTILLFLSLGVKAQFMGIAVTTPLVIPKDSMRVQANLTTADTVAGWSHIKGDPSDSNFSVIGGNNHTITFAVLDHTLFGQTGGAAIAPGNGLPSTTTFPGAPGVMAETFQNSHLMDTTKHMLAFSGLISGHTYKVAIGAVFQYNQSLLTDWDVAGTSWGTIQQETANGTVNPNPTQKTWIVTCPINGIVLVSFGTADAGQLSSGLSAITITEQ